MLIQKVDEPRVVVPQLREAEAPPLRLPLVVAVAPLAQEAVGHLDAHAPRAPRRHQLLVDELGVVGAAVAVEQREAIGVDRRLALRIEPLCVEGEGPAS